MEFFMVTPSYRQRADPTSRIHVIKSPSSFQYHHERGVIQRALVSSGFNRTRAADALGISRVTLYKKMKKYGLLKESAKA
jgi:DNA-binding NtrC family response regulator